MMTVRTVQFSEDSGAARTPPRGAAPRPRRSVHGLSGDRLSGWAIWALVLAGVGSEVLGQTLLASFGFYTLHIVDPAVVLLFAACALSLRARLPQGGMALVMVLVIASLVIVNFVRGLAVQPASALLWARANLSIAPFLLLAVTCPLSSDFYRTVRRALIVAACLLCALAVLRHLAGPSLFMTGVIAEQDINDGGRVLSVYGAYLLALGAALLLSDALQFARGRRRRLALLPILVAVELTTGQGTASIALVTMCGLVLFLERGPFRSIRASAGGVLLISLALVASLADVESLPFAAGGNFDLAHRSDNFQTRQAIWTGLKAGFGALDLKDQLFGLPAGQLPDVIVSMQDRFGAARVSEWKASIHSMYYGSLPIMGYVGLSAYIFLLILLALGSLVAVVRARPGRLTPTYPLAMCIGTAILSVSYEVRNDGLLGVFFAIWWYRFARSTKVTTVPTLAETRTEPLALPV